MKLSIIIPVYNVEEYIARCLDSVLKITSIDWECILIDDGSKDGSGKILDEYQEKYPDKFIVRHNENSGVSAARNMGIDLAAGDRIMFIDPDDYLFDCADKVLERVLTKHGDKDIICLNHSRADDNGITLLNQIPNVNQNDYIQSVKRLAIITDDIHFVWGKIYKTSIIKENNILFDVNTKFAEDNIFLILYLKFARSIGLYYKKPVYAYYQRGNGAVKTLSLYTLKDILKKYDAKCSFIQDLNISLSYIEKQKFYMSFIFSFTYFATLGTKDVYRYNMNEFVKVCNEVFSDERIDYIFKEFNELYMSSFKAAIHVFLMKHKMYRCYYLLFNSSCRIKLLLKKLL